MSTTLHPAEPASPLQPGSSRRHRWRWVVLAVVVVLVAAGVAVALLAGGGDGEVSRSPAPAVSEPPVQSEEERVVDIYIKATKAANQAMAIPDPDHPLLVVLGVST